MKHDSWSPDACVGNSLETNQFKRHQMVCTKTLYNYIDLGLLPIKNLDLPMKLHINTKTSMIKKHKKKLGKSIEEPQVTLIVVMNTLPRRILKYKIPEELFEAQLDIIYSA